MDYYVAYYETEAKIKTLYASINGGDYFDVSSDSYSSVSPSNCLIHVAREAYGSSPMVNLKAIMEAKEEKLVGEVTYSLEGYRIKARLGDYAEYYNPFFSKPTKLINISTIIAIDHYVYFEKDGESFYLPLSKKSPSRLADKDGYSPVDMSKVFKVSGDRKRPIYSVLYNYYAKYNPKNDMTFVDMTDTSEESYSSWRLALGKAITTFNSFFLDNGLDIKIREVSAGESKNDMVYYRNDEVNYAGMCRYYTETDYFSIYINSSPYMAHGDNALKSTIVHEMGHLLGFPDSAYSLDDSLYSYSSDRNEATYFSPNDLATYRSYF